MYGNDDMIINWWNLQDKDKNSIWQGAETVDFSQKSNKTELRSQWLWWKSEFGLSACQQFYADLQKLAKTSTEDEISYRTALYNGKGILRCGKGWSDFFYIPSRFSTRFVTLSKLAFRRHLFLEIAVNNILRSLDDAKNFEILKGKYLPDVGITKNHPKIFWRHYDLNQTFIHPFKMNDQQSKYNMDMLNTNVIQLTKRLLLQMKKCDFG